MLDHKPISIADQIFEQLEKDILTGKYPIGEAISESRLSAELGVSRTPIREAILRLEQERLIEECSRGFTIVGITRQDMLDMYEIRIQLEGLAAARAAQNISPEALAEMGEILEMQGFYIEKQQAGGGDNSDRIKDLDSRFHELLYEGCGSSAYRDTLLPLHKKMTKFRKASVRKSSRAAHSLQEHRDIWEALKTKDSEKAAELTVLHVKNARDSIAAIGEE